MTDFNNVRWVLVRGTTSATANTETSHAHGLTGAQIVHVIFTPVTTATAATVYLSTSTASSGWDQTNIYAKPAAAVATAFIATVFYYGGAS